MEDVRATSKKRESASVPVQAKTPAPQSSTSTGPKIVPRSDVGETMKRIQLAVGNLLGPRSPIPIAERRRDSEKEKERVAVLQ